MTFSSGTSTNFQFLKLINLFVIIFKKDKALRNGFLIVFGNLNSVGKFIKPAAERAKTERRKWLILICNRKQKAKA